MKYILKNTLGNYVITDPHIKDGALCTNHFQVIHRGVPGKDLGIGAWGLVGITEFKPYTNTIEIMDVAKESLGGRYSPAFIDLENKTVTVGCSTVSFDKLKEVYDAAFFLTKETAIKQVLQMNEIVAGIKNKLHAI